MRQVFFAWLDLALPPACLHCSSAPASHAGLCLDCQRAIERIGRLAPRCHRCGRPSPVPFPGFQCNECTVAPPQFASAFAGARYAGVVRELLRSYKFRRDSILSVPLVSLLQESAGQLQRRGGGPFDAVVPVPSHPRREKVRRFSPVHDLALAFAHANRLPFRHHWLARVREGTPQGSTQTRSRRANVRGAFVATGRRSLARPRSPRGQRILIIDDVLTSGSTARECAKALCYAGAAEVSVIAVARGGLPAPWDGFRDDAPFRF